MTSRKLDWLSAPQGADEISLWSCLHDATLLKSTSDRLHRTLELEFDVFYIREHRELPETFHILFRFDAVQSTRATVHVPWPGGCTIPDGASREEQMRLHEEYLAKWREETVAWDAFEQGLIASPVEVSDATLLRGDGVALALSVFREGELAYSAVIRSEGLNVVGSEGTDIGIERLIAMGDAYWEAFERKGERVQ
jgi:hypothetical protein